MPVIHSVTKQPELAFTKEQINDPIWRICNLYKIKDKAGNEIRFVPNPSQQRLLKNLSYMMLILKARQMGFSTLIQIMMLDQCIFVPNTQAGVIAQDAESASKIFRDKLKFAWERMPSWVTKRIKEIGNSVRELEFSNGSSIRVATSLRSTTLQFLHVSEFGKICAKFPGKAREVMTGSIPALGNDGYCFLESTAEGREGKFYELVTEADTRIKQNKPVKPRDWHLNFFPWYECEDYVSEDHEDSTPKDDEYFATLEASGSVISQQQRNWYLRTKRTVFAGDDQMMKQEYPASVEEAFETSTEGCWFTTQINIIKRTDHLTRVDYMRGHPVHTCWDIGRTDGTAIWLFQHIGLDYRFIDFIEDWDKDYDEYVRQLLSKPYLFGTHYLPHDAKHRRQAKNSEQAKTTLEILEELGLKDLVCVPKTPTKLLAITQARQVLPNCWFDRDRCAKGFVHLESYKKKWDSAHACWSNEPDHNVHSEAADAFMQFATGYKPTSTIPLEMLDNINRRVPTNPFN